jgi:hypothetical protein
LFILLGWFNITEDEMQNNWYLETSVYMYAVSTRITTVWRFRRRVSKLPRILDLNTERTFFFSASRCTVLHIWWQTELGWIWWQQDRQCAIHVTLTRFHVTIVAVERNKYYIFWICVCSLRYPACNAHVPYCHLWPAWLRNIFPHYLINGTIKKILHLKCVFWFSL